jgi:hypothetical protein
MTEARRGPDPRLADYLRDPFLARLHELVEGAGHLRSVTVDVTEVCNLRCTGCYFFVEDMDDSKSPREEVDFDRFVAAELARGTNYMTVLGGEPSLVLPRLKKLHDAFRVLAVTNGIRKIPVEGFETLPIAISVWGDHRTDTELRGRGKIPVFAKALKNYRDDPRALWYFAASAGNADEIASVSEQCVENGNFLYFNYYEDNEGVGGSYDHRLGFERVRREIDRVIERYPDRVLTTAYLNQVATTDLLFGEKWSYDVCPTITPTHPRNADRVANGNPYSTHFRAFNPDLTSTRRCCVGEARDCGKCHNAYARHTWIMVNKRRHLDSKQTFTDWLTSIFTFYAVIRAVPFPVAAELLPEIHRRTARSRAGAPA